MNSTRQYKLFDFTRGWFGGIQRKYTNDPYWFHLYSVADMAKHHTAYGFEIGILHDIIEDTEVNRTYLQMSLAKFGYSDEEVNTIVAGVVDLTDVFTHEAYPHLNRAERKRLECHRLFHIPPDTQTVKYCDLIDNISSIVKYDKPFAKIYVEEKRAILDKMDKGNEALLRAARYALRKAEDELYPISVEA